MSKAVIDQPGLRVIFFGLLISFVLGISLRTQISSTRIENYLQKAIQASDKDLSIDFEESEIRLSKWGFPWPHLIIEKIRISPKKSFCQNSQIYIDELEIPINLSKIFNVNQIVEFVRAQNVEIRIADLEPCLAVNKAADNKSQMNENIQGNQNLAQSIPVQNKSSLLKEIAIEQLKIVSLKNIEQPIIFKQVKAYLGYESNKVSEIDFRSRLYSLKDSRTSIFFLIADFNSQIKIDADQNIDATFQIKGRLLDGDLQIFSKASSLTQKISYELNVKKASLKAFSPFLQKTNNDIALDKIPLAINFYMLGETQNNSDLKTFLKFKDISAFGDNMSLDSTGIDFEFFNNQTRVKPFQINFKQLSLSSLKSYLLDKYDFQSFENLGILSGAFTYEDKNHWLFDGQVEKSELIFSNRGSREIQTIDSVKIKLDRKNSLINLNLEDFILNSKEIVGSLTGQSAIDQKNVQINANLEGQLFNEKIWNQLTFLGQSPILKLNWNYSKNQEERQQIKLNISDLKFLGVVLNDIQIDFLQLSDNQTKSLGLNLKSNKALIQVSDLAPSLSKPFFNDQTELKSSEYLVSKLQVNLQGTDWRNMAFEFESQMQDIETKDYLEKIKSKGEWKSNNSLSGQVFLQNQKRLLKFNLFKSVKEEIEIIPERKE